MTGGDELKPAQLEELIDVLEARTEVMAHLQSSVDSLAEAVVSLRHDIGRRPTRRETEYKRRRAILAIAIAGAAAFFVSDQHVEICGPGARAEAVVDLFAADPSATVSELRRAAKVDSPAWCDVTFPLHTHGSATWPTTRNYVGMTAYLLLILLGALWVRVVRVHDPKEEV